MEVLFYQLHGVASKVAQLLCMDVRHITMCLLRLNSHVQHPDQTKLSAESLLAAK